MQWFLVGLALASLVEIDVSKENVRKTCFTVCFVASLAALVIMQVL